ncbi:MAG: restriction endonuclease PLD domain-containing protein [Candidatus Margulisiibacteriota bacterium]
MIYANNDDHGGELLEVVDKQIKSSSSVAIASGYVSDDIITRYEEDFYRIADKGGIVRLLVGMAFYEGLAERNLRHLLSVENRLRSIEGNSGIFVCYTRRFHGKVYYFSHPGHHENVYVGSSNFSRSGLSQNLECTAEIIDERTKAEAKSFIEFLFSEDTSTSILKAEITIPGSRELLPQNLDDLDRYDSSTIDKSVLHGFDYPLSRIVSSDKSSLNVYFGKGRWARTTGKVIPRPWYEVELIAPVSISANPLYPKGDFLAYTDDDYIIPMKTSGDYFKNIRSRSNLQILGQWIKNKLQRSGALIPLTPVTQETLDRYGNDTIRFYKIRDGEYYMEF